MSQTSTDYHDIAREIIDNLTHNPALSLTLTPEIIDPVLNKIGPCWELQATRGSGKEILHTSSVLAEIVFILDIVSQEYPIYLRISDGEWYSCSGYILSSLCPPSDTDRGKALAKVIPLTSSNHGRARLMEMVTQSNDTSDITQPTHTTPLKENSPDRIEDTNDRFDDEMLKLSS